MVSAWRASSVMSASLRESSPVGLIDIHELSRLTRLLLRGVHHLGGLAPDAALEDRRSGKPAVLACRYRTHRGSPPPGRQPLTQTIGRGQEDRIAEARLGVHREHHSRRPRSDRTIRCTPADNATAIVEPVVNSISDRAIVVEGKDLFDRCQDGVDTSDIEKRLLLTCERGIRQVLGRRTWTA